jgi:hypothetical protein
VERRGRRSALKSKLLFYVKKYAFNFIELALILLKSKKDILKIIGDCTERRPWCSAKTKGIFYLEFELTNCLQNDII